MKISRVTLITWLAAIVSGLIATIAISQGVQCYKTLITPGSCITTSIVTLVLLGFANVFIQTHYHKRKEDLLNFAITLPLLCIVIFGMVAIAWKKEICAVIPNPDTREERQEIQTYYIYQLGYWTVKDTCSENPPK